MTIREDVTRLVSARTGIEVSRGGIDRALGRFVERREAELRVTPAGYLARLGATDGVELERLVNSITVGYTWFFRDSGQLAAIEALLAGELGAGGPARVWVPGCSTGEDVYSLAFVAERIGRACELLGTDVNSQAIEHARRGSYRGFSLRELDPRATPHFSRALEGSFVVDRSIRERVSFARHNLIERAPVPARGGKWDIILCRNVLIYFVRDVAQSVLEALARSLAPGGYLVLGASEVVFDAPSGLEARYVADRLVFRRVGEGGWRSVSPESAALPRDWLLPSTSTPGRAGLVSAFPFSATEMAERVPPSTPSTSRHDDELARGHALLDQGDAARARDAYANVVADDQTRADARMYAGVARYLCGEVEPAMDDLRAALFLDEALWPAAFYLALCHENSGHPEEALRAYRHVVRLDERGHAAERAFGAPFDAWRKDLSELARRRVAAASSAPSTAVTAT